MPATDRPHLYILTGASRGLGLALADALLDPRHELLCLARHPNAGLSRRAQATPMPLTWWAADLTATAIAIAERLSGWLGAFDGGHFASATLINNAGLMAPIVALRDAAPADLAPALRVGLEAPLQLTAAFVGATRGWTGARKVLNISSGLGRRALASQASYCAAKAGLDHFTRCLALEEAAQPNGARVCALAPGVIDTDMQAQMRGAELTDFPGGDRFRRLHRDGELTAPSVAARRVLAYLARPDYGSQPVADVRDPA